MSEAGTTFWEFFVSNLEMAHARNTAGKMLTRKRQRKNELPQGVESADFCVQCRCRCSWLPKRSVEIALTTNRLRPNRKECYERRHRRCKENQWIRASQRTESVLRNRGNRRPASFYSASFRICRAGIISCAGSK